MSQLLTYSTDIAEEIVGSQQAFVSQSFNNVTSGNATPYFPVKSPAGFNLGAIVVRADVALTAGAAENATAGTDVLSEWLSQYELTAGQGGPTRLRALTRLGAEAMERLLIQPANAGTFNAVTSPFTYPRGAPANFAGAGNRTDTSYLIVPAAGGQSAQLRVTYPPITSTFAANITASSITFTLYAVPTILSTVTATTEIQTQQVPVGTTDLATQYFPDDMSPLFLQFVGETASATTITRIVHETQSGRVNVADFEDFGTLTAVQQLFPMQTGLQDTTSTVINLHRQRARSLKVTVATAVVLDLVYVDIEDAPTAAPSTNPATTPIESSTSTTGTVGTGGTAVPVGKGGIGSGNQGPRGGPPVSKKRMPGT